MKFLITASLSKVVVPVVSCLLLSSASAYAGEVMPQQQRFLTQLNPLEDILTNRDKSLDTIVDESASKIRTYAFMMEELNNIYKAHSEYKPALKELKSYFKDLEDLSGKVVDAGEHLAVAEKIGFPKGSKVNDYLTGYRSALKSQLISYLKDASVSRWDAKSVEKAQIDFANQIKELSKKIEAGLREGADVASLTGMRDALLSEQKSLELAIQEDPPEKFPGVSPNLTWLDPKAGVAKRVKSHLSSIDWDGPNKDRKFLAQSFIDHFEYMQGHEYNQDQLQGKNGVHQLRRDLRKFAIRLSALNTNGKAVLDDKEMREGKYSNLPNTEASQFPIVVNHDLFVRFSDIVDKLGKAKDLKEAEEEWLARALEHSGEFPRLAGEKDAAYRARLKKILMELLKKMPDQVDPEAVIKEAFKQALKGNLLKDAIKNFETQLNWEKEDFGEDGELTPHLKKQRLIGPNHR